MPPEDRARLLSIVVNRFQGDASLFEDGIRFLEERTGLPVLALLPCLARGLDEEDRPFRIPVDQGAPAATRNFWRPPTRASRSSTSRPFGNGTR